MATQSNLCTAALPALILLTSVGLLKNWRHATHGHNLNRTTAPCNSHVGMYRLHDPRTGLYFIHTGADCYMSVTEVPVAAYARFIELTGYVTDPELAGAGHVCSWNTDGDGIPVSPVWVMVPGASWRCPRGPTNGRCSTDARLPVVQISARDAMQYCAYYGYSLPTESQWETAAMLRTNGPVYPWGDNPTCLSGKANIRDLAFIKQFVAHLIPGMNYRLGAFGNIDDGYPWLAPVASYVPSPGGFYDIIGNAAEWCYASSSPNTSDASAVMRGGSSIGFPQYVVTRHRVSMETRLSHDQLGFRVACSAAIANHVMCQQ